MPSGDTQTSGTLTLADMLRLAEFVDVDVAALDPTAIQLLLHYEDETPMAEAEIEAVFGDQRMKAKTDAVGKALLKAPDGFQGPFRVFLHAYPEPFAGDKGGTEKPDKKETANLTLLYEDQSPMAEAAFEVEYDDGTRKQGKTDATGSALLGRPLAATETCRIYLRSYPEKFPEEKKVEANLDPVVMAIFAYDSAFPGPAVYYHLRRVQDVINQTTTTQALIVGHTDKAGSVAYNQGLSERRAQAVLALLKGDLSLFEALEKKEHWTLKHYQAMLRGLGCNPGPIDGQRGAMTKAAVEAFQQEYNQNVFHSDPTTRAHPDLTVNGSLNAKTKAAIRDSYVAMAPHIPEDRFTEPASTGCSKHHTIHPTDPENRRAVVAFFETPLPGGAASGSPPLVCRQYAELVGEKPTHGAGRRFFDCQWLPHGDHVYLSALTTIHDDTAVQFIVFRSKDAVPVPPPDSSGDQPRPTVEEELDRMAGKIAGLVCFAKWKPAAGFDPFDYETWLIDYDLDLEIADDEDELSDDDPASGAALFNAPGMAAPYFLIEAGPHWAVSGPPGRRLNRFRFTDAPAAEGIAIRSDGALIPFKAASGLIEADDDVDVVALALRDGDIVPDDGGGEAHG